MTRRKKRFLYGLLALVVCGFLVAQGLRLVMCSRICNYAFQVNGMGYRAKPVVGYVSLYGVNLCRLLQAIAPQRWKNFVKDHDFVELKLEDRTLFFDASLYDFNLDCTTTRNSP